MQEVRGSNLLAPYPTIRPGSAFRAPETAANGRPATRLMAPVAAWQEAARRVLYYMQAN
jgi:hypothetical protein